MSARRWKHARSDLRPYERDLDRKHRRAYRPPWWARLLSRIGWQGPARKHRERWEGGQQAWLRHATKAVAHAIVTNHKEAPRG